MTITDRRSGQQDVAWAVEDLRRAEARLARRRQTDCGPSETDRLAARFVAECWDAQQPVTPKDLAQHLEISTAATTAVLDRLTVGNMIRVSPHPHDGRSKLIEPFDRNQDPDAIDPVTAHIRSLTGALSDRDAAVIADFVRAVAEAVESECSA